MDRLQAVILDVDGTLVNSNDGHARAWVTALAEHGHQLSYERARQLMGMGGDNFLPNAVGMAKDSPQGREIDRRQAEIFKQQYLPQVRPFPQTRALLQRMLSDGLKLVVATSAKPEELRALLERAGVDDLIETGASSGDADRSKPSPDIVQAALARADLPAEQVLMLGDTPYDVQAGGRAGVATIALRCGGFSDADLAGALAIFDDPADLLAYYHRSPLAAGGRSGSDAHGERMQTMQRRLDGDRVATTDHETIRNWVAERDGLPAMVRRVGQPAEGELVINLPNDGDDRPLVDISWTDFFQRFDDRGLAFVYRDVPPDMDGGRAWELVPAQTIQAE